MRRLMTVLVCSLLSVACKDDGGGGGDGSGTGTGSGSDGGAGTDSGTGTGTGTGGSDTSGEDGELQGCDPYQGDACPDGVCAGTTIGGFYCRPTCPADAAVGDACGSDGICLEAGELDRDTMACFETDGCDLVSGDGCTFSETCTLIDAESAATACVPSGGKDNGEACAPNGALECGSGLACFGAELDDDGPEDGGCFGWCTPGEPEPANCSECIPFTDELGTCAECSVLDQDCPEGSQCHPVNELFGGICGEFGPGGDGDPCTFEADMACMEGFLCIENEDDVLECVETCDPDDPMCTNPDKNCTDVGLLNPVIPTGQLGLCIETPGQYCDPAADPSTCGPMEQCIEVGPDFGICAADCDPGDGDAACMGNYACIPMEDGMFNPAPFLVGNGACGLECSGDGDCGGDTCLLLDGLDVDGLCGVTCTTASPTECAMDETCVPTPGDPAVGACIKGGAACDPGMPDSCLGNLETACVALDGMASTGVCVDGCFVHDPAACMGMAMACHEKTDPLWNTGSCIGQDTPCDPIAQTGCGLGQTCGITGGAAIGGLAYMCEEPGPVAEGGDCSSDDCDTGLACVEDVCRTYCDPQNDQCQTGACVDISATLYLPADSIGICM